MDWIIFGLVVTWLGIVSWFDIRKSEIPHSAWVIIPLIGACFYRTWQGNWALVLLTILVAAVSERERISQIFGWEEIGKMIDLAPIAIFGSIPLDSIFTSFSTRNHWFLGCVGVEVVGRG